LLSLVSVFNRSMFGLADGRFRFVAEPDEPLPIVLPAILSISR